MKTERGFDSCREWRGSLGAYALGDLPVDERAALEAHLDGCERCREEVRALSGVARLLPYADPAHFGPAPKPSPDLGERIAATIGAERRVRVRRRRRFGFALGGATAAAAAALAIDATLEPHAYGTEIHMYVSGMRSGTLCRVFLRGPGGERVPAGTFRYRWGDDSEAVLSSALDLSRTTAISVHAGARTFTAPVGHTTAAAT
jgi:hypothetical protein